MPWIESDETNDPPLVPGLREGDATAVALVVAALVAVWLFHPRRTRRRRSSGA